MTTKEEAYKEYHRQRETTYAHYERRLNQIEPENEHGRIMLLEAMQWEIDRQDRDLKGLLKYLERKEKEEQ